MAPTAALLTPVLFRLSVSSVPADIISSALRSKVFKKQQNLAPEEMGVQSFLAVQCYLAVQTPWLSAGVDDHLINIANLLKFSWDRAGIALGEVHKCEIAVSL